MMMAILKALTNTQQRLRVLEAAVADNFILPSNKQCVIAGVAAAEAYHTTATTASGTKMSSPAPIVLYDFATALIAEDIGNKVKKGVQEKILQKIQSLSQDNSTEVVAYFTLRPCYDPTNYKVVMVSQSAEVRFAFTTAMNALDGVTHYTAPAPASGQEDELQKWIEKLESIV